MRVVNEEFDFPYCQQCRWWEEVCDRIKMLSTPVDASIWRSFNAQKLDEGVGALRCASAPQ